MAGSPNSHTADGPQVGLATYDPSDPVGTFRPIERFRPPPEPGPLRALVWPLRLLFVWLVNLGTLAAAGVLVTNVGPADPLAYVWWSATFGILNVGVRLTGRLWRGPLAAGLSLAAPFVANVAAVGLMTVVSPPVHTPDLASIAKAAVMMWLVNLPMRLVVPWPRHPRGMSTSLPIGR
jgi:hypothetical protein